MHGSIDWFDINPHLDEEEWKKRDKSTWPSRHPVFGLPGLSRQQIITDPYWPESTLHRVYRVKNLDGYFDNCQWSVWPPLIISPSFSKMLNLNPITEFWEGLNQAGGYHKTFVVIGFSLPAHDQYVQQALFSLIRNFQHFDTGKSWPKGRFKAVDFRVTSRKKQEYRDTFRFVDWSRADVWFDGFTNEALDMIFSCMAGRSTW